MAKVTKHVEFDLKEITDAVVTKAKQFVGDNPGSSSVKFMYTTESGVVSLKGATVDFHLSATPAIPKPQPHA